MLVVGAGHQQDRTARSASHQAFAIRDPTIMQGGHRVLNKGARARMRRQTTAAVNRQGVRGLLQSEYKQRESGSGDTQYECPRRPDNRGKA